VVGDVYAIVSLRHFDNETPFFHHIKSMDFSSSVTVPQTRPDQERALCEQLVQDGFSHDELHVPPLASPDFALMLSDACSYSDEVRKQQPAAWDMRCERWLNRLSTAITGKLFTELPITKRRAICHAAAMLASCPELLP
jgi:hypothetical protein